MLSINNPLKKKTLKIKKSFKDLVQSRKKKLDSISHSLLLTIW